MADPTPSPVDRTEAERLAEAERFLRERIAEMASHDDPTNDAAAAVLAALDAARAEVAELRRLSRELAAGALDTMGGRRAVEEREAVLLDAQRERDEARAEVERLRTRLAADKRWNDAIDWLLNSRHTADPDIQGPFWDHVDGKITLDELRKS